MADVPQVAEQAVADVGHRVQAAVSASVAAQQFGGQRPCCRAALAERLAVQTLHRPPGGRRGAFQPAREVADHALVDGELAISAEFDDQGAEQLVVRRLQRDHRNRTQPRAQAYTTIDGVRMDRDAVPWYWRLLAAGSWFLILGG